MQTQYGQVAEDAITAKSRNFMGVIVVDWNNDGNYNHPLSRVLSQNISSASVDRALKGSMPEELMLVQGSSAAELEVVLEGDHDGIPVSWMFSPFNTESPIPNVVGVQIVYYVSVESADGFLDYKRFFGTIVETTPNRADNTVTIRALDQVEKLRKPVNFTPFAVSEYWNSNGRKQGQYVNSAWVIDNCLRWCNVSPTPYTWIPPSKDPDNHEGIQFWASYNNGWTPNIGWTIAYDQEAFPTPEYDGVPMYEPIGATHADADSEPKPWVLTSQGEPGALVAYAEPDTAPASALSTLGITKKFFRYWTKDKGWIRPEGIHTFGFTLHTQGYNGELFRSFPTESMVMDINIGGHQHLQILIQDNKVRIARTRDSGHPLGQLSYITPQRTIPAGEGSYRIVGIVSNNPDALRGTVYFSGIGDTITWQTWGPSAFLPDVPDTGNSGRITVAPLTGMADAFYHYRAYDDYLLPQQGFKTASYGANLDQGLLNLSHFPVRGGEDAWDVITSVADAEFGSVFFDEDGIFRFWNLRTMLLKQQDIVREFTIDDLESLQFTNNLEAVRNTWSVTPKTVTEQSFSFFFESSSADEFITPGKTTNIFVLGGQEDAYHAYPLDLVVRPGATEADDVGHGFVPQYQNSSTGDWAVDDAGADPVVRAYRNNVGDLVLEVINNDTRAIRFADSNDSPALKIWGTSTKEHPPVTKVVSNDASVVKYGIRNIEIEGDWIQDGVSLDTIRDYMMPRWLEPNPVTDAISVPGDPRLQLGDAVKLKDAEGFGEMDFQIIGINETLSTDEGLTSVLTVERVTPWVEPVDIDPPDPPGGQVLRTNLNWNPNCGINAKDYWNGGVRTTSGTSGMQRTTGYRTRTPPRFVVGPRIKVQSGKWYRMSYDVKGMGGTSSGQHYIDWYSSKGWLSSTSPDVTSYTVNDGQVIRVDTGAHQAPPGAISAVFVLEGTDAGVIITAGLYEKGDTEFDVPSRPFFDGNTTGGSWVRNSEYSESVILWPDSGGSANFVSYTDGQTFQRGDLEYTVRNASETWSTQVAGAHDRFEVRVNDYWPTDGTSLERSEVASDFVAPYDTDVWGSFAIRVNGVLDADSMIVGAWWPDNTGDIVRSSPLSWQFVDNDLEIVTRSDPADPSVSDPAAVQRYSDTTFPTNTWVRFVYHVQFEKTGNGILQVWRDGVNIFNQEIPIGYNDPIGPNWRHGVIRSVDATGTVIVEHANVEVSTNSLYSRIANPLPLPA